jgi:hypothetical protein
VSHRRTALLIITTALSLDAILGIAFAAAQHIAIWQGLFCALANAVTVGGTVPPTTPAGYVITATECLTVVPLFAASLSFFTSGLTAGHVAGAEERIKKHVEDKLAEHHKALSVTRPARRPPKPNASSERMAKPEERP